MPSPRPNILLIVADDLGFSDIGAFGSEIDTPFLDALAQEGLRLTDFHSAPACSPTRAMLLTGTDHHIAGIGSMLEVVRPDFVGSPGYEGYLNERVVSVTELLRDAGYATIISGKWHLGNTVATAPQARGFTRSFALLPGGADHFGREAGDHFRRTGPIYIEDGEFVTSLPADFYSSDYFATRLIGFLAEAHAKDPAQPFFAYLPFSAPHWPLQAPACEIAKYHGRYNAGPDALRAARLQRLVELGLIPPDTVPHPVVADEPEWERLSPARQAISARAMEVYAAMVDRMDQNIGRVVAHLKSTGQYENTLVIFLSDNGAEGAIVEAMPILGPAFAKWIAVTCDNSLENAGHPGSYIWYGPRWSQAATAPSRLVKGYTTEGGIRVPAFIRSPGGARAGEISDAFSTVMDITPTLLELAGTQHPGAQYQGRDIVGLHGRSLCPFLQGAGKVHPADTSTGWELFGRRAIRKDDWKAVYVPDAQGNSAWQLYNLTNDRGEVFDQAATHPEILSELLRLWQDYCERFGVVDMPLSIFDADAAAWESFGGPR